jgi:hypothetical protein
LRFSWANGLDENDVHEEIFSVEKRGRSFPNDEDFETEVPKWLRQQPKYLCCGFQRTGKAMDKCISVGGGYVEK